MIKFANLILYHLLLEPLQERSELKPLRRPFIQRGDCLYIVEVGARLVRG